MGNLMLCRDRKVCGRWPLSTEWREVAASRSHGTTHSGLFITSHSVSREPAVRVDRAGLNSQLPAADKPCAYFIRDFENFFLKCYVCECIVPLLSMKIKGLLVGFTHKKRCF